MPVPLDQEPALLTDAGGSNRGDDQDDHGSVRTAAKRTVTVTEDASVIAAVAGSATAG